MPRPASAGRGAFCFVSAPPAKIEAMWDALTETEKQMLYLEQGFFKYAGAKDSQIRDILHMSPTQYYAKLNALIDDPRALAWDPLTVKRLVRLREARRGARAASRVD